MIFDVTILIVMERRELHPYKTVNLMGKCVCPDCSTDRLSLPPLGPLYSLKHNNIEIRPINKPTVASQCSSEQKSRTLNQISHFKSKARND